jgi:CopG family nickel-responsive transcriptional regulator
MAELVRFGIAMERELLEHFDALIERRGFANRSEALRDLVRRALDQDAWDSGRQVCATITLMYDHHVRELTEHLTEVQHDFGDAIVSTLHVHLDHHHCMEVIACRGRARQLREVSERLLGIKGVLSGGIVASALPKTSG